jgi:hypothetical protein
LTLILPQKNRVKLSLRLPRDEKFASHRQPPTFLTGQETETKKITKKCRFFSNFHRSKSRINPKVIKKEKLAKKNQNRLLCEAFVQPTFLFLNKRNGVLAFLRNQTSYRYEKQTTFCFDATLD